MSAQTPEKDNIVQTIWERAGGRRRLLLLLLIIAPTVMAAYVAYTLLPTRGWALLDVLIIVLFALLFGWISVGFWTSVAGVLVLLRRYDRFALTLGCLEGLELPDTMRTALLFPIYNEDSHKVVEGVRTMVQSLKCLGLDQHFDVFLLSDTTNPDVWVEEEEAWYNLCREENAFERIFYRHRKSNMKRKSGNIADFCRRWGANYRYMIIFDADSLMAGATLVRMVQAMEAHPEVGILQTPPKAIKSRSLIARVQQFANHLYGPIFASGLHYWQLGDAQYWGHNAIIRIEPFMRHCQLPSLPGKSPLGGEILSHDFVESALMRRAGYGVWLAYELGGSYEQSPPSLIDELARDRRWCQGNLQHSRLLFTRGFFPTHRALFINGIMSYGSALLWFFFLLASSAQALVQLFILPEYFPTGPSLFPAWPKFFPAWAISLLSGTAALLFLPKIFSLLLVIIKGGAAGFGGIIPMTLSAAGEVVISTFLAPVRMLFHSFFVVITLLGRTVNWSAQNRDDRGTAWSDALRFHWWGTLLGVFWGLLMYFFNPGFFLWLSPIVIGLAISIPLSTWTSRVGLGEGSKRLKLFLTPADTQPPAELLSLEQNLDRKPPYTPFPLRGSSGFVRAAVIPHVFALHATLVFHKRRNSALKIARLRSLIDKGLAHGPDALTAKEKIAILSDPDCLRELHRKIWDLDNDRAAQWGIQ